MRQDMRLGAVALAGLVAFLTITVMDTASHASSRALAAPAASGTGRDAARPEDIPPRGWWQIIKRTVTEVYNDRLLTEAAGITFFALLALFPGLAALLSVYGLILDPATLGQHLSMLAGVVPGGGMEIITNQLERITSKGSSTLSISALVGFGISLWSANQAIKAMIDSLNIVYEQEERRGYVALTAITLAFTLGAILFLVLAILAVIAVPVVLRFIWLGSGVETLVRLSRWPLLLVGVGLFLAVLYRYGPHRERAQWRWVTWGSAFAAFGWIAFSLGFSWYVENFGRYNETYGSLGAVIGFMTWIWLSATVVLVGAELDAEMEHQTARDTTTGPERPVGTRGARMADEVA